MVCFIENLKYILAFVTMLDRVTVRCTYDAELEHDLSGISSMLTQSNM